MLQLLAEDVFVLAEIAAERSLNQEQREEVKAILIEGFERYGDETLVENFGSREKLFRERASWLIENFEKAGQSSAEAFGAEAGRNAIVRMLGSLNVPKKNVEDLADEIIFKFWRHRHAEKYNPLKAPWGHHVRNAVRTCVASFWSSRTRQPDEIGISINQVKPTLLADEDSSYEPYEKDQFTNRPENQAILHEFYTQFETFLSKEKPFRTTLYRGYREICYLLPPGIPEIQTSEPYKLFVRAKGRDSFRVVDPSWNNSQSLLVRIEKLQNLEIPQSDGSIKLGKTAPNPQYSDQGSAERIERTPLDVYKLLIRGFQVTEIAKNLNVGDSTAHNWVRRLQELFAEYWLFSDMIPQNLKYLAIPVYRCPNCDSLSEESTCYHTVNKDGVEKVCGTSFQSMKKDIYRLNMFPWEPVRGNPDIKERADKYKAGMRTQVCSM
jgi:DNA-directed RNA polymerase specialized sigma24 family protein